jgi:signal transduction histidine kinase
MSRSWAWLQIGIGWLPICVLYAVLVTSVHRESGVHFALFTSFLSIAMAAVLGIGVQRLAGRLSWPHPFRPSFLLVHLGVAVVYAGVWQSLTRVAQWMLHGGAPLVFTARLPESMAVGIWLYAIVAGVAYATTATARAAQAETLAAQAQLAALRAQLNPHFLFNALHTVVHLIPREPTRAAEAAELVAGLLRTTIEEDRDVVTLGEEWAFVGRYLEVERIRFGDRLAVRSEFSDQALTAELPAFALQTLIENAVRHGAAPSVEPTEIVVSARTADDTLTVTVRDTGVGSAPGTVEETTGTGLARLRDRLATLYGTRAGLALVTRPNEGFTAVLTVPQEPATPADT